MGNDWYWEYGPDLRFTLVSAGVTATGHESGALLGKPLWELGFEITPPILASHQKLLAAHRIGVTTVILPRENEKDLADVPKNGLDALEVHLVDHVDHHPRKRSDHHPGSELHLHRPGALDRTEHHAGHGDRRRIDHRARRQLRWWQHLHHGPSDHDHGHHLGRPLAPPHR